MRNREQHEIVYKQLRDELILKGDYSLTAFEKQISCIGNKDLLEQINIALIKLNCIALKQDEIFKLINY